MCDFTTFLPNTTPEERVEILEIIDTIKNIREQHPDITEVRLDSLDGVAALRVCIKIPNHPFGDICDISSYMDDSGVFVRRVSKYINYCSAEYRNVSDKHFSHNKYKESLIFIDNYFEYSTQNIKYIGVSVAGLYNTVLKTLNCTRNKYTDIFLLNMIKSNKDAITTEIEALRESYNQKLHDNTVKMETFYQMNQKNDFGLSAQKRAIFNINTNLEELKQSHIEMEYDLSMINQTRFHNNHNNVSIYTINKQINDIICILITILILCVIYPTV